MSGSVAVILMAYGTPGDPSEIEAYYTDIRRGRPPTPEALADLTARYVAIGGVSPSPRSPRPNATRYSGRSTNMSQVDSSCRSA